MADDREQAKRRREAARRTRRGKSEPEAPASSAEEPIETVKQAAKTAAAAAAVGAAVSAARAAIASRDGEEENEVEEPKPQSPQGEQEEQEEQVAREEPEEQQQDQRPAGASLGDARKVVESAKEQLAALLGRDADSVSAFERTDDGWVVSLEVVELARIPESTDVLASYELTLDGDGNLVRYERGRRYYRSQADSGGRS